jgi:cyclopropane fatty-acyl-phospholipid synthase-like methyltransferase
MGKYTDHCDNSRMRLGIIRSRVAWFVLLCLVTVAAQWAASHQRKTSTPYTGDLSIFESSGRDQRLHIQQVMDALAIAPGKNVADIGAGSGWFTVRAAQRVSTSGTVYAVDINPEAIKYINERLAKDGVHNVKTILNKPDNPQLPAASIDAVLLLKTYHEVADPVALMRNLRPALRKDARVGIIDRNGDGTNHGVQKNVVMQEMQQAGYELKGEQDSLVKDDDMDYFLVFAQK